MITAVQIIYILKGENNNMDIDESVADFMKAFLNTPEPEIDHEYFEIEDKFREMFGHGVPRAMLPDGMKTDTIKEAMKTCMENNEDNLFEVLGVKLDDNNIY